MYRVMGAALLGVEGVAIEVEVRLSAQLPRVDIVGLPELSVRESVARVRAAISAAGERFPQNRITVNLAPAGVRKSGSGLDLAIAVAILVANGAIEAEAVDGAAFAGELALDGRLRPVRGSLAMAMAIAKHGCRRMILPTPSASSAALTPGLEILPAQDLNQVISHLNQTQTLAPFQNTPDLSSESSVPCMSEVRGQNHAKRALEIAAAGGHAILFYGPPGSGKTMLARRLQGLLPTLDWEERLAATKIHGAAGLLAEDGSPIVQRPFRAPHHSASAAGLLGGGQPPTPGEISLAHGGVLLLDELPEFDRRVRESLRQVLEDHFIVLARAGVICRFPADFLLVCTANPCPCGFHGCSHRDCRCDGASIERYKRRISGPLLDRIDLHVPVPAQRWREWSSAPLGETSDQIRERVVRARGLQQKRTGTCNARIRDVYLEQALDLSQNAESLLGRAVDRLGLSARATRRLQRIARTIADLEGEERVQSRAIGEALSYRREPFTGNL